MVERLGRAPASVSELAAPLEMSLPGVVQHLAVLEQAGVVTSHKVGRVRTVQLVPGGLGPATRWIGQQGTTQEKQLDRLGEHLSGASTTRQEH